MMLSFPLDVWGKVSPTAAAGGVEKVKVVKATGGGFLFLTVEGGSEYDVWLETIEDVESDLAKLDIEWPTGDQ
jgi:hypothetical protein